MAYSMLMGMAVLLQVLGQVEKPAAEAVVPPAAAGQGNIWKLTFADEFDGTVIDPNLWTVVHRNRPQRKNNFWHRECAVLDGRGLLRVITRKSPERQGWYDTACLETQQTFTQRFGYFEIRAEMQSQPGFWSAFWAMPAPPGDIGSTRFGGMDGTELDIFEKNTLDEEVQHTLHWDGYGKHHKTAGYRAKVPGVMEGFHTFGLLWTPEEYVFYVDGKQTWRTSAGGVAQVPVYLIISSEIGDWGGDITQAQLPDEFRVDYVRAWQIYTEDGQIAYTPKPFAEPEQVGSESGQ
ncbi:MAG: glycoside hydrolase family 16 protein [Planctomycetes bacterium]|nr:glycoside hydrolase family 16 protein [Planctomycetota bacterium]